MDPLKDEDSSGPSSLSSDQASLCVIPDPYESSEEDGFIYLDKSSLPASLSLSEQDRTVIVFHSVDEEYPANQDIACQYIRPEGWAENSKDQICLFKVGWVTKLDAIFMLPLPLPSSDPIGKIVIPEKLLPKDTTNLYQFCYMRDHTLLGASTPFQFFLPIRKSSYTDIGEIDQGKDVTDKENCVCSHNEMVQRDIENSMVCAEMVNSQKCLGLHQCSSGKVECVLQPCKEVPQLLTAIYKDLELSECCSNVRAENIKQSFRREEQFDVEIRNIPEGSGMSSSWEDDFRAEITTKSDCVKDETDFTKHVPLEDDVPLLKQRLKEVDEEKKYQYNSLLMTMNKYAEVLSHERAEKESLHGHLAELRISHKMMCSENSRLKNELERMTLSISEQSAKLEEEKNVVEEKKRLLDMVKQEAEQIEVKGAGKMQPECMCDDYRKQVEDLTARLSDYEIVKNCLEVELKEEIKLAQERDQYLVQLEQMKLNDLQLAHNWLASTPNATTSGNTLLEMEETVMSTLEALECALKEMEVLRSQKAAVNKANRVLREHILQERTEMEKQKSESEIQICDLEKIIESEKASRGALLREKESLTEQLHLQIMHLSETQNAQEALAIAKREIETLNKEKLNLGKECTLLRSKSGNIGMKENTLLKNLQEAKEEYLKLYSEKMRIQEKLSRLQQKVKSKKISRAPHQEAAPSGLPSTDFMSNVNSSWRATIDELM